jgi:gamma-glutamylcyclotransferase (GGCT)/AIG2-like uncharacterized protein YtfP
MTEAEQIMKRCQVGTRNYEEANNLHAECYRMIGKLLGQIDTLHAMYEQASRQRDELMDQQRAQVAALRGRIQ